MLSLIKKCSQSLHLKPLTDGGASGVGPGEAGAFRLRFASRAAPTHNLHTMKFLPHTPATGPACWPVVGYSVRQTTQRGMGVSPSGAGAAPRRTGHVLRQQSPHNSMGDGTGQFHL
jgi:hypothetical protein